MTNNDLPTYLTMAQSTIDEVKLLLTGNDMENKVDNMCMVFVLHGLHKDLESVRNQILTNPSVPTVENLMDRLLRVPPSETMTGTSSFSGSESSVFFSNTTNRGGRGRGARGGRGGRSFGNRPQCSYCNRMGHTKDKCQSLIGFPEKSAHMTYLQPQTSEKQTQNDNQNVLSDAEFKEYLQLKGVQQGQSSAAVAHTGKSTVCLSQSLPIGSWLLDSGASDHIAGNPSLFSTITQPKIPHYITLANGSKTKATGIGQATPLPPLSLNSVLFIPDCPFNLVSVSQLTRNFNCY